MCFQGCDASLLLNSSSSTDQEKDSFPNLTIHGVDVIELAKLKLESVCRGVVSCADIIALATRDAVALVCMFTPIQPKTVTFKVLSMIILEFVFNDLHCQSNDTEFQACCMLLFMQQQTTNHQHVH